MRNDADFAAYLAARWPFLVRSLVLIGCPRAEAEDVALAGLARCYASWDRVLEADDVNTHVYATVLDEFRRSQRRRRPDEAATDPPPEVLPDDDETDLERLCRELEDRLRLLTAEHRQVLVLRFFADLTEIQVSEVLDIPVGVVRSPVPEEVFRTAPEAIEVAPPPYAAIVARAKDVRRRRRRVTAAVVTAAAVVVAGLVWVSTRPATEPGAPDVVASQNPLAKPWYGAGRLHLEDVAVELPQLEDLVAVAGGAVYADGDGVLTFAGPTGELTELGRTPAGSPVVASDERSWVAWLDEGDNTEMVVHDVVNEVEVARVEVPPSARPVALDQNRVFYVANGRTYIWEPLTGRVVNSLLPVLLDVESATRVYGDGTRIDIVQPYFAVNFLRRGTSAELSPGGAYVLARRPGPPGPFWPLLYDARTGDRLPTGIGAGELVVDAAFGPVDTADYLVMQAADVGAEDPLLVLRSCYLLVGDCTDIVPLPTDEGEPRLAH